MTLRMIDATDRAALERLVTRTAQRDPVVTARVRRIVRDVRRRGDAALRRYASRLDGLHPDSPLILDRRAIENGARDVPRELRSAVKLAARHIRRVARRERPASQRIRITDGVTVQLRVSPLDRVGCYVPAGRYPLLSSLLMTAVPAKAAGAGHVIVACPRPVPAILYAAAVAGVDALVQAGGAHAVAALAYGTESVAAVQKIVGPGNAYVSAAKALVAPDCAIDFYAGPTELVVISEHGRADWIAHDLLAQAEHDPDARVLLLTPSRRLARAVAARVRELAPRDGPAAVAIRRNGAIVLTRSLAEAIALSDRIAPEHVTCDNEDVARRVRHAGTVFVGGYSVPAAGDYVTGSNHVLPTAGAARSRGGLSATDFVKVVSVQRLTAAGLRGVARPAQTIARAEGLEAHARSIEVRS